VASPLSVVPETAETPSQSERAYHAIRELIVTLELPPGSVVSEADLMARLGLGRTPIREALRTLARERLVEVYPRRGIFVSGVDARDLAALSEVRSELEPFAARLAASRLTSADRVELDALLSELSAPGAAREGRALMDLDHRIHRFVYAAAHNAFLETVLDEYYMHALRIWYLALERVTSLADAVLEHRALLEAIRDGDAERAAAVMTTHVDGFEGDIRRSL
jgi:GntR family transcriptional regulator, rspAB operon transcriptional repressor